MKLVGNEANHVRPKSGVDPELEVHQPHLAKLVEHLRQPAQLLHHRMFKAIDEIALTECDLEQVRQRLVGRPLRLR